MCLSKPTLPNLPANPKETQQEVPESVQSARSKDRQRAAAAAANQGARTGSSAAGLLTPARTAGARSLIAG